MATLFIYIYQQDYGQHVRTFSAARRKNLFLWRLLTFHGLIFCHSKANSLSHFHVLLSALADTFSFRRIQSFRSKSLIWNFVKYVMNHKMPCCDASNNQNRYAQVHLRTNGSWSQKILWRWTEDGKVDSELTPPHPTATHLSKQVSTRLLYNLYHGKRLESNYIGSAEWCYVIGCCRILNAYLTTHFRESLICVSSKCLMNSAFWWSGTFVNASMLLILKSIHDLPGRFQLGDRDLRS